MVNCLSGWGLMKQISAALWALEAREGHYFAKDVVVTTGAIISAKPQSDSHHQQTNTHLFTGRMPFLSSNQQCHSTEKITYKPYSTSYSCKSVHNF